MENAGLVLEGGGLRSVFTAGALDYLMERDVYFSYVVGASAGACNMLAYVSKQIGHSRDNMIKQDAAQRFYGFNQLLKSGKFLDLDKMFFENPYKQKPFDFNTYFNSEIENEMVVTNCLTGKADYLQEKISDNRLSAIVKASSSMPLITPMVEINDCKYLDGSLADSIPIQRAMAKGYKKNVVILTRNKGDTATLPYYQKKICEVYYKRYPELLRTILTRPTMYQSQIKDIEKLEVEGKVFVIRPGNPTVKRLENDYETLLQHYLHGYYIMKDNFESIIKFLSNNV
jgi:predicted patatin/cPLA2 family phospholipase